MPENRNQMARFGATPSANIRRSRFPLSHTVKFSGNVGELLPIDCWEVLPGDSFRCETNKVVRFQTLLSPIMDNIYMDVFWFYAPSRILWDHWKNFCGESERAWYPTTTYTIPTIDTDDTHKFAQGSIADYLGIPPDTSKLKVNALPFRMYGMIANEFFRDQNLEDPIPVYTGDSSVTAVGSSYSGLDQYVKGGMPFIAAKKHDVFTSSTPGPQKGPDILIPGGVVDLAIPVVANSEFYPTIGVRNDVRFNTTNSPSGNFALFRDPDSGNVTTSSSGIASGNALKPYNLGIDTNALNGEAIRNEVINGTINQLRQAFQIQKLLEADARGGSRYRELLRQHFNVISPDASQQIPQYLGGNRFPIVVHQIANTGETENAKLGNVGAMSVTTDQHEDFVFSSTEHGYIMCLAVVRYDHTYGQGMHRFWSKQSRFDFFWPEFSQLGNVPVYMREIDARYGNYTWTDDQSVVHEGNRVWGYQEAWYDYRYIPDRVSGEMRPGVSNTLASWHLADYYAEEPRLSSSWIKEDKANVDRVLAVSSSLANQFWADFYFKVDATRPMPLYSIPGLADHY